LAEKETTLAAEDIGMVYDLALALASVALMLVPSIVEELQHRSVQHDPYSSRDGGSMSS
jgi:hypothetical protein